MLRKSDISLYQFPSPTKSFTLSKIRLIGIIGNESPKSSLYNLSAVPIFLRRSKRSHSLPNLSRAIGAISQVRSRSSHSKSPAIYSRVQLCRPLMAFTSQPKISTYGARRR